MTLKLGFYSFFCFFGFFYIVLNHPYVVYFCLFWFFIHSLVWLIKSINSYPPYREVRYYKKSSMFNHVTYSKHIEDLRDYYIFLYGLDAPSKFEQYLKTGIGPTPPLN